MKHILIAAISGLFFVCANAQENNPLINSGELITQGSNLHDEGKYKEAINLYKKVPRGDTNYYRAVYEIGLSQMTDSQFSAALATCKIGLSEPNEYWPNLLNMQANLVDDMGNPDSALRIYNAAIKMFPAFTDLYMNKGTTLLKEKKYAEAEEIFKQGLLINPYQASSHYKLGVVAMLQGKIVQSFLSYVNYMLIQPGGRYQANCISFLSKISKGEDEIRKVINERTEELSDNFSSIERIVLSKIALDKQYKVLTKIDDPIIRQLQVICEKLEYDANDNDFWMQYYVPLTKQIFTEEKFEAFVNYLFSDLKIDAIQDYIKKKDKNIKEVIADIIVYYTQIRETREENFEQRKGKPTLYHFDNGKLYGKGILSEDDKLKGNWEFYYSPGNIRSKGNYDDKGEKNGPWEYYHFDGKIRGKQAFKGGLAEGEEIFYYENGAMQSQAFFKNGKEEGLSKTFFAIGIPRYLTNFKDGKMNGERKLYYGTGVLRGIENYKDDSLHGIFKTYHQNGQLESEGKYDNGTLVGTYKTWHDNGALEFEGTYTNGKFNGPAKVYHENGKLKVAETLLDGQVNGEYKEYHDNGQLFYTTIYKAGKLDGKVDYMDDDGKLQFYYEYDNDVIKKAVYYDKAGKELGVAERKSKRLDLTTWYADGFKRSQAVYNDKGMITGQEVYFYRNGKKKSEKEYKDGLEQGTSMFYYPNGNKEAATDFADGERHGYNKYWYIHGAIQDEGWYQEGLTQGRWLSYDETGKLSAITEYLNGDMHGYKEEFHPDGKKNSETKYNMGWLEEFIQFDTTGKEIHRSVLEKGNGKFKVVFFNGKTFAEGLYKDGELEGPYKFFYFDGKVNTEQFYKKGQLDSNYKNYQYSGLPLTEGKYKMGRKEGVWKNYYESGKLKVSETYSNGELNGKKTFYFENGKIDAEMEYESDMRQGWTKKYDQAGNLMYQTRFKDNIPVAYTYNDKTGKLLPEIPIPGGTGTLKTYYANGNLSSEFGYSEGKVHGPNKAYFANGKLWATSTEDFGQSEGVYKYYFENGQVQYDYIFLHDNLHGSYKEYNEKGFLTEEGTYHNGYPHGIMKVYDDAGKLKETRYYYYGKLLDLKK